MNTANNLPSAVENFDRMPNSARISLGVVEIISGKSRATIYRWVSQGKLPKPVRFGNSHNSWTVGDIRSALGIDQQGAA